MSTTTERDMRVSPYHKALALHFIVGVFIAVALAWGGFLLAFGDGVASSPTYDVARQIWGGMRTWGGLLVVGAAVLSWGLGRDDKGHPRALNITLAGGVFYYVAFSLTIVWGWVTTHEVPSGAALVYNLAFAAFYYKAARVAAPPKREPLQSETNLAVDSAGAGHATEG